MASCKNSSDRGRLRWSAGPLFILGPPLSGSRVCEILGDLTLGPSYVTEPMHMHELWAGQLASSHMCCARHAHRGHAWLMFRPGMSLSRHNRFSVMYIYVALYCRWMFWFKISYVIAINRNFSVQRESWSEAIKVDLRCWYSVEVEWSWADYFSVCCTNS